MQIVQSLFSIFSSRVIPVKGRFSCFNLLPIEIKVKIVSLNYLADIASFLTVSKGNIVTGKLSIIQKAQTLGFQKVENIKDSISHTEEEVSSVNESEEEKTLSDEAKKEREQEKRELERERKLESDYKDAHNYLQKLFFRITVGEHQTREESIINEQLIFDPLLKSLQEAIRQRTKVSLEKYNPSKVSIEEKILFLQRLDHPLEDLPLNVGYRSFYLDLDSNYANFFLQHFLGFKIPDHIFTKFSFKIKPQEEFRKFALMLLLGTIAANEELSFEPVLLESMDAFESEDSSEIDEWKHLSDINDTNDNNLLHLAAFVGSSIIFERLCKDDSHMFYKSLRKKNKDGWTPLDMALSAGNKEIVDSIIKLIGLKSFKLKCLFEYGLKINDHQIFFKYLSDFSQGASNAEIVVEIAQYLIELHEDCSLTERSFNPLDDTWREIFLREAVRANCLRLVKHWGTPKCLLNYKRNILSTAARQKSYASMHQLIFAGCPINDVEIMKGVFTQLANYEDSKQVCRCLVRLGANFSGLVLNKDHSLASYFEDVLYAEQLLKENREVELREKFSNAYSQGYLDGVIRLALQNNALALAFVNGGLVPKYKKTIIVIFQLITDMGISESDLNDIPIVLKNLILLWIPEASHEHITSEKKTLMTKASSLGLVELVKALINKGWNVNLEDGEKHTPLKMAIRSHKKEMVKLLLEHGSIVDFEILKYAHLKDDPEIARLISKKFQTNPQ